MTTAQENADFLLRQARAAGIVEPRELANFMGQMQIESGGFRSMHEGLRYRPERLLEVFGPRTDRNGVWHDGRNGLTTLAEARAMVAKGVPGIAEAIYGGGWGARNLGNTEAGDGWKFHGRGYVHLTGRDNYERVGKALGIDLVNNPNLAADRETAARIAIHYWESRVRANGHELDVRAATLEVNGGYNHLAERSSAATAWQAKLERSDREARAPGPTAIGMPRTGSENGSTLTRREIAASAIYQEAYLYFLADGNRFEYGRGDARLDNREGNLRTDPSRNGQDLDGDGLRGVDCSAFVWRGLKNAGYDVAATPFTTHALFSGSRVTAYARQHFDVLAAAMARRDNGTLQPGDIILFKDRQSDGQHVGIFKAYAANGGIEFIGSQVQTGPAQVAAGEGSYWNGGRFEIVGALRAKAEFQIRPPLHALDGGAGEQVGRAAKARETAAPSPGPSRAPTPVHPPIAANADAGADGRLQYGEKGPAVESLQLRLADLGYRGRDGKPLAIDFDFGDNTRFAVQAFQRDHGLQGLGVAGPKTAAALDRAEGALMSHRCHAHHALYAQVLEKVHAEERARGVASGHHSQRIAAALAVECLREGITRVDRVELNRDASLARAVQVSPLRDEPGLNRSTDGIDTAQAARQTMLESTEQLRQVAANVQAQQRDELQRAAQAPSQRAQPAYP